MRAEGVQDFVCCMRHVALGDFPVYAFCVDKWQYLISGPGGKIYYLIIVQISKMQ